jgi:hypothetical protein
MIPVEDIIKQYDANDGIDVHRLKAGTIIIANTRNSKYKIIKGFKDVYDVTIQGGKHFAEPTEAHFAGSTYGGSMMKIGWIGYGMHMEVYIPSKKSTLRTTGVRSAEIIGDGWNYVFEWEIKKDDGS